MKTPNGLPPGTANAKSHPDRDLIGRVICSPSTGPRSSSARPHDFRRTGLSSSRDRPARASRPALFCGETAGRDDEGPSPWSITSLMPNDTHEGLDVLRHDRGGPE